MKHGTTHRPYCVVKESQRDDHCCLGQGMLQCWECGKDEQAPPYPIGNPLGRFLCGACWGAEMAPQPIKRLLKIRPTNLTLCLNPTEHNPNHGTNYRFHVLDYTRTGRADWEDLTELEMEERGRPFLVSSSFHFWDNP